MTTRFTFGECDCCGKRRVLHRLSFAGLETYACRQCMYESLDEDADAIQNEIDRLVPKAESGEQWAHICELYRAHEEAKGVQSCTKLATN